MNGRISKQSTFKFRKMPISDQIRDAVEVVSRYGEHISTRLASESGVYKETTLPDPAWRVRWAMLTLIGYELAKRLDPREAAFSLQSGWADLERYINDAYVDGIEAALLLQEDSEQLENAKQWINAINQRWLDAFDAFDEIMAQLVPTIASKRNQEIIQGLDDFRCSIANTKKQQ